VAGLRSSMGFVLLLAIASAAGCAIPTTGDIRPLVAPARPATPLAIAPTPLVGTTPVPGTTATPRPSPKPHATPKPTPKPRATAKPTKKPGSGSFYRPPGWDGYSDVDCPDFDTHAHAQSFFRGTGGSTANDPYRLDADHDGVACESLP
jgi:Excalibur calcium-binding domain